MGNDITSVEYTTGNLESIDFIAGIIGNIVVVIISIVGFGIVMSAIAKNAFAGLYATNPKWWDRVDEAHKAGAGLAIKGSNIFQVIGSVGTFMLSKFPNIKAMTEFEDEILDAKAYFLKALPLACVQILIGVFIFKGYPTEVANKFTEFGTGMFDLVLTNIDPVAWVEALPDKLAILTFSTDGAQDDVSKAVNKIAKKVANSYIGALDDMTKEKRISTAKELEDWVITNTNTDNAEYCNNDKYDMSVTATVATMEPNITRVHQQVINGVATFAYYAPMAKFNSGTAKDVTNMWIRYDLVFTPVASKGDTSSIECNLTVPTSVRSANINDNYITVAVSNDATSGYSITALSRSEGYITVNGSEIKVKLSVAGNIVTIKPASAGNTITDATTVTNISGLYYVFNSSKHNIKNLYTGSVSNPIFSAVNAESGISDWLWGESPVATENTTSEPTDTTETVTQATVTDDAAWSNNN